METGNAHRPKTHFQKAQRHKNTKGKHDTTTHLDSVRLPTNKLKMDSSMITSRSPSPASPTSMHQVNTEGLWLGLISPSSPTSPSSPASMHHGLIPKPPSPLPAAADPQVKGSDNSKIEVSNTYKSSEGENNVKYKYILERRLRHATWTTEGDSPTVDDGYAWRKYGKKSILNSSFPRNYYRCAHKTTLGCQAVKHVQQISQDPPRYKTSYKGEHNCKNPPNTPQITHRHHYSEEDGNSFSSFLYEQSNDNIFMEIMGEMNDYHSIFFLLPEDYEFEEDTLIQLWLAGGYIIDEQMGQDYFRSLLNGEYALHSGTNFVTKKDRYRINIDKIKTLLNDQDDNASFYLKYENGCLNNCMTNSTKIQHVSLVCNEIDDATTFQTLQQFNELRTLLFLHNYGNKVTQIPDQLFQSFKKLQALDLSGTHIKKLPSSVSCMIHLHYLDLSWTLIEWLPDIICSLVELQTLKLRGCTKLRGLPRQLKKLIKLRQLDIDVLRQLATLPKGIGALVNLRTLSTFLVGTDEGCKIQELKDLNNLTGDFCIAMLENVGNRDEAKVANLKRKQYLNKLELRWTTSQLSRTNNNCYDVLKCLQPCSSLKELQIFCYEGSTFPSWVGGPMLNQLVSITFFKCEHVSELPLMEELPCLKHLVLVKMNGVKKIDRRGKSEDAAFFRLEKLEINEMQALKLGAG